jgi:predicted Zn-dependent protease
MLIAVAALGLMGCAGLDSGSLLISEEDEIQLGAEYHAQLLVEMPEYTGDPRVAQYVRRLGQSIVPHTHRPNLTHHFTVVDVDEVNAFAVAGGYVYVTVGLLRSSESGAELASVLAHELGHISARHGVRAMETYLLSEGLASLIGDKDWGGIVSGALQFGSTLTFSKEQEREADKLGVDYAYLSGWNPWGLVYFFQYLERTYGEGGGSGSDFVDQIGELFSTHPPTPERIENVTQQIRDLGVSDNDPKLKKEVQEYQEIRSLVGG